MAIFERNTGTLTTAESSRVQDVDLGDIAAADTFTLTYGGQTTGTITFDATTATFASTIQAALVALSNIAPGDIKVQGFDANTMHVIFTSQYVDSSGQPTAITITGATGFTPTGVTNEFNAVYKLPLGSTFAEVCRLRWGTFENAATNNLYITDADGRIIANRIAVDTNPVVDEFLGYDGEDNAGNGSANVLAGVFASPAEVIVVTNAAASGDLTLFTEGGYSHAPRIHRRKSGTLTTTAGGAATGRVTLGGANKLAKIKRIKVEGFDSSTDFTIADAYAKNIWADTARDATPSSGIDVAVGGDGVDQDGNTASDTIEMVAKGDLDVTIANGGNATTGSVEVWTAA